MLHLLFSQCDGLARLAAAACGNAAIPSIITAAATFAVTRRKAWNSASRYWAWWLTLLFVVLLPVGVVLWRPPARFSEAGVPRQQLDTRDVQPTRITAPSKPEGIAAANTGQPAPNSLFLSSAAALFLLYCGAVLLQISRVAVAFLASIRLKLRAVVPADPALIARFHACSRKLRVRRRVSLFISYQITAPVAVGYWRPCILLPRTLIDLLDASEIDQVLSHELAHISRYDDYMIGIQKLIEALFVFHPLVHFISRRIDLNREMACDDQVISSCQPRTYAACLTKVAELLEFGSTVTLAVPLLTRKSHLASRVETMLDRTRAHIPAISSRRLVPFAMFGVLAVFVSLRAPALIAFPAVQGDRALTSVFAPSGASHVDAMPFLAIAEKGAEPAQAGTPGKQPAATSSSIDSIAVTSADGASTTFERNGNERNGHSPFPHGTIVFERNGDSYIIRDRSTLAAAQELLRPQQELSRQQEALGAQQEKLGEAQAKLGEQQEALSDRSLDPATISSFEKQLRALEEKIRSIDAEKSVRTANQAQERLAELESLLGEMQSHMGDEQGKVGEAQGKLGEQQSHLGEEQGRLGEQQSKLGERQGRQAKRAEQELKELIQHAEAQGLAQPLR